MSTEPSRTPGSSESHLVIDGISYIPSSVLLSEIPKLSLKDNSAFGMVDHRGEAPRAYSKASAFGFYFNDTRYVSTWDTSINGSAGIPLANELRFGGNTLVLSMTNRDLSQLDAPTDGLGRIPRDTFLIRRILSLVDDTLYEILAIRNFDQRPHTLRIEQWAGSQFDDLFEVRGFPRAKRGEMLPPEEHLDRGFRTTVLR